MMPLVLTVIIWMLAVCMYCLFKSRWIRECTPTLAILVLVTGAVF